MLSVEPLVDQAGLAPPDGVDLTFTAAGNLYATHGLHPFAARCPPPLVDWAISRFTEIGGIVLDPMVGSGTAMVEACLLGRRAWGADIDPLARLIAKTKATPVDLQSYDQTVIEVRRLLRDGDLDDSWRPALENLEYWFRDDVARDLARLREAISRAGSDPDVADLLWVAFSSLIVSRTSVANARDLVHSRHHHRAWAVNPGVEDRYELRVRQIRRMMSAYVGRLSDHGVARPEVAIMGGDAKALQVGDAVVDLVFTSPPYCSALDYTRAHMFAVAWLTDILGTTVDEYRRLGRAYLGSERAPLAEARPDQRLPPLSGIAAVDEVIAALADAPKRAWIVHRYFREMAQVLSECARVTRPGGHLVLVVCPSNIRRVVIPTHRLLVELAATAKAPAPQLDLLECKERIIHDRRRVMPYLETAFGPRMRTEYVLIFRRPDEATVHGA
jgi:DNA modification methylase